MAPAAGICLCETGSNLSEDSTAGPLSERSFGRHLDINLRGGLSGVTLRFGKGRPLPQRYGLFPVLAST